MSKLGLLKEAINNKKIVLVRKDNEIEYRKIELHILYYGLTTGKDINLIESIRDSQ